VAALKPGVWQGPRTSVFGPDLVRVTETVPSETPPFETSRDRVAQVWTDEARALAPEARYQAPRGLSSVIRPDGQPMGAR
jgi:hypothetical protein